MKKLYLILSSFFMIALLLTSCKNTSNNISIKTDRNSYDPKSSSIHGIYLSPEFKGKEKDIEIKYHWITTEGEFISSQDKTGTKEIVNTGDPVLWNPIGEKASSTVDSITINLEAENIKTGKIIAKTSITVQKKDSIYELKNN